MSKYNNYFFLEMQLKWDETSVRRKNKAREVLGENVRFANIDFVSTIFQFYIALHISLMMTAEFMESKRPVIRNYFSFSSLIKLFSSILTRSSFQTQ